MIVYKESAKLRAEAYKGIGYFFASIFGLSVINLFVYGQEIRLYLSWRLGVILISLYFAYYFVGVGVKILRELDERIYIGQHNNIKTTEEPN
ncbi:MAG: hypothetical protein HOA17_07150 [Candidatus Melainabacteria bacterium]|jgi:hypothetical protein|nr:hypothetical protein [Candidatus Melainabacteria bacterium]